MTALAVRTGAINLGQGFPDDGWPGGRDRGGGRPRCAAVENQYAPLPGVPALREAVLEHQRHYYGLDPEDVLVTFGATEAIAVGAARAAAIPATRSWCSSPTTTPTPRASRFAGAPRRPVTLRPPEFALDPDALRAAIGPRARLLLLNSPHNPTGRVLDRPELELIADGLRRARLDLRDRRGLRASRLRRRSTSRSRRFRGWRSGR